jgi:hypothetical protein
MNDKYLDKIRWLQYIHNHLEKEPCLKLYCDEGLILEEDVNDGVRRLLVQTSHTEAFVVEHDIPMTPNQTMDKARELARYGFLVEVAGRLAGLRIQMEYDLLL